MAVKKNNKRASDILTFWCDETPPDHWFNGGDAFDALLRRRFSMDVQRALGGHYDGRAKTPDSRHALILLLDQMTRNLYRGTGDAFAGDEKALVFSLMAVDSGQLDEEADVRRRSFLLMPLMHSEDRNMQELCVVMLRRYGTQDNVDYARRHRDTIARFGRFPHRNEQLGRQSTEDEREFLKQPGSSF